MDFARFLGTINKFGGISPQASRVYVSEVVTACLWLGLVSSAHAVQVLWEIWFTTSDVTSRVWQGRQRRENWPNRFNWQQFVLVITSSLFQEISRDLFIQFIRLEHELTV